MVLKRFRRVGIRTAGISNDRDLKAEEGVASLRSENRFS